jgi:hypothetical protein
MVLEDIIRTVNQLGRRYYWAPSGFQDKDDIRGLIGDWRRALKAFLSSYAFERSGRSPYYSGAALKAVDQYERDVPGKDFEFVLWQSFLEFLAGKKVNAKNNPLLPAGNRYNSVSRLIATLEDFDYNLVRWSSALASKGDIEVAWKCLVEIRGIGPKIASLYLRDIVDAFEIDESRVGNKAYLQPIDVWTRRGAKILAEIFLMTSPKSDWDYAQVLVEVSERAGVRSSLTNTGLWILGAQLTGNLNRFHEALSSIDNLQNLLLSRARWHRGVAEVLETLLEDAAMVYNTV